RAAARAARPPRRDVWLSRRVVPLPDLPAERCVPHSLIGVCWGDRCPCRGRRPSDGPWYARLIRTADGRTAQRSVVHSRASPPGTGGSGRRGERRKGMSAQTLTPQDASHPPQAPKPSRVRPLLLNGNYLLLWSGQTISSIGTLASGLAFPLLVFALTGSAT